MNMTYIDNELYIDLIGDVSSSEIEIMKCRLFDILNIIQIDNIVINVDGLFNLKKDIFNGFLDEYHKLYKGNVIINNI